MAKLFSRAKVNTATAGTGTVTLGAAVSNAFCTFAEAGVANADVVAYVIEDGTDFEIGIGTYTSAGTTLSRDTVRLSKIAGTAGTTKLTLSGSAVVYLSPAKEDLLSITENNGVTNAILADMTQTTIKGRAVAAGTGDPTDLTAAQAAAIIGSVGGALLSKVVGTTYDLSTASGTQDVTGFGFDPTEINVLYCVDGGIGNGAGFYAGGAQGCVGTDSTAGTTARKQDTTAIFYFNAAITNYQNGAISLITDGFRITWTKAGSPTGTLQIKSIGRR